MSATHSTETWKAFEDNPLTHSAAHYLMTILALHEEQGYARLTDIAHELNITRGSCSISLKALKAKGLVTEDDNKHLLLTESGNSLAQVVRMNDALLQTLLTQVLSVDPEQAEIDACKMEHLLSIETSLKLCDLVRFVESGHPAVRAFLDAFDTFRQGHHQRAQECKHCGDHCAFHEIQSAS
jgi:Mn-dependent DtxR family transcriptional regulator